MNQTKEARRPNSAAASGMPFPLSAAITALHTDLPPRDDDAGIALGDLAEQMETLRAQYTDLQQAVNAGAQLQRTLCSPRALMHGQFDIASEIFPVRYLSGDFCKVWQRDEQIALAVGDIAGKGVDAGLWLAHLLGLVSAAAEAEPTAEAIVAAVNRGLLRLYPSAPMTALFFALLHPATGELAYCNAGLPAPLLLRNDGAMDWLASGGPLLGAVRGAAFVGGSVQLAARDTLVGYSDGIIEARNVHDEEFGSQGLLTAARTFSAGSAGSTLYSLIGAVQDFAGSRPRTDDLTLMVVRRHA
jgi:sigma-B regulation protein RsbU (phosphoserine phosphatase)